MCPITTLCFYCHMCPSCPMYHLKGIYGLGAQLLVMIMTCGIVYWPDCTIGFRHRDSVNGHIVFNYFTCFSYLLSVFIRSLLLADLLYLAITILVYQYCWQYWYKKLFQYCNFFTKKIQYWYKIIFQYC